MPQSVHACLSRRRFLMGASAGLAAGLPLGWLGLAGWQLLHGPRRAFTGRSVEQPHAQLAMPGPFPGRVVEIHRPGTVLADDMMDQAGVRTMLGRGMCELTGADSPHGAWRRFFTRDDVVGIKVNPVGRKAQRGEGGRVQGAPASISSPELLLEIVKRLQEEVGLRPANIIVFERYANEFREAGYADLMSTRPMDGVRWLASAYAYDDQQLAIDGQDPGGIRDRNIAGYDPDVFVSMGFSAPGTSTRDDRRFRSHCSTIVTRLVSKIITIPVLKDHKSAGVTLALKNMSHGMNNNVCRSHISGIYRLGGGTCGPNQCNTFIPTAAAQPLFAQKATLHILDGLIGVYEGGPGNWNRTWGTWRRNSLFFATDPVAMDHVGWDIIDRKRAELGWAPVGNMGLVQGGPRWHVTAPAAVAALATPAAAAAIVAEQLRMNTLANGANEPFDRRQPEHIVLAGILGLGKFGAHEIDHRVFRI